MDDKILIHLTFPLLSSISLMDFVDYFRISLYFYDSKSYFWYFWVNSQSDTRSVPGSPGRLFPYFADPYHQHYHTAVFVTSATFQQSPLCSSSCIRSQVLRLLTNIHYADAWNEAEEIGFTNDVSFEEIGSRPKQKQPRGGCQRGTSIRIWWEEWGWSWLSHFCLS